jgi:hypothetical protein
VSEQEQNPEEIEAAEDAIDISDIEQGIDSALAGLPRDAPDPVEETALLSEVENRGKRPRRSPALASLVALAGVYLLTTMWSDFRYWLRSENDLRDLGNVTQIYKDGEFVEDFDNQYVRVTGTPDVQHAARMTTEKGISGYVRIREAGGSLFASVPHEDQRPYDRFTGTFEGRMRDLSSMWNFEVVQQFFDNEQILQTVDVTPVELARAMKAQSATLKVDGEDREIDLSDDDMIRLVVEQPEATVQLGKGTWKRVGDAESAVGELGYPFALSERKSVHFHTFVVRISESERDTAQARLNEGHEVPADNPDPKIGAMILPRTATYVVPPEQVGVAGDDQLVFEYGDNTTSPGYRVEGGKLVERSLDDGKLGVDVADVIVTRIERQVRVNPNGYVVVVEERPESKWLSAVLFLVVSALVAMNLVALGFWVRRLRAA